MGNLLSTVNKNRLETRKKHKYAPVFIDVVLSVLNRPVSTVAVSVDASLHVSNRAWCLIFLQTFDGITHFLLLDLSFVRCHILGLEIYLFILAVVVLFDSHNISFDLSFKT